MYSALEMKLIVILVVLQNVNEFFVDSWRCVFGEMLINRVVL